MGLTHSKGPCSSQENNFFTQKSPFCYFSSNRALIISVCHTTSVPIRPCPVLPNLSNHTFLGPHNIYSSIGGAHRGVLSSVQQGVLSPVLPCVCVDGLLKSLQSTGVGCFIGNIYTGILPYADDIVLLAPTANAACKILRVCEEYAAAYSVKFNADKSYCTVCESSRL